MFVGIFNSPIRQGKTYIVQCFVFFLFLFSPFAQTIAEEFSVGTIERPPFSFHNDNKELTGFSVELWELVADRVEMSYQWDEKESFKALIDDVAASKNTLAIANISMTSEREQYVDYSHSVYASGMAIAVKQGGKPNWLGLIWESGILWFIGGALLVLLVIAHVVWFFERDIEDARHDYFRDDYVGGVWDAFWWAFIIMTMGGFENQVPHKVINRLLAIFWIFASLFFISTLTAKITTTLTIAELKTGIESYKDLAGKRIGVTEGSTHERFLNVKNMSPIAYPNMTELYADLKEGKLDAVVADFPILSYYAKHQGADWMIMAGEIFNPDNYAIIFPENSPHVEDVNKALLQIREEGKYDELYQKYFGAD
ncbi:MAG: Unknown protein [uncultured Thiotrichaceae bacterium]|uniref:Glutamine ABC transporter, periplasmic glutamine-binding protein (TC 3.A.1.3.2) n=1 Tax=uncultured Thiotrichaceae bacterium TaxID=298394 RepID=A0A6S6UJ00_9GAMM|nr:MAG: Unknown protein [uncultured Thiotrichaceae bacterium]